MYKTAHGYSGDFYDLESEGPFAPRYNSVSRIILSGTGVNFSLYKADGTFDGTLPDDGNALAGTWKMLYFPS